MVKIHASDIGLLEQNVQSYAILLEQDFEYSPLLEDIEKRFFPGLRQLFSEREFTGKKNDTLVVPVVQSAGVFYFVFIGIGAAHDGAFDMEQYRRAVGRIIRQLIPLKVSSVAMRLPDPEKLHTNMIFLAHQAAEIVHIAWYHFDQFITDDSRKQVADLACTFVVPNAEVAAAEKGIKIGEMYAHGVNKARLWVDLPPDHLTPLGLAEKAKEIAKNHGFKITIFDEKEVNHMGMGGLSAVSRGSERDCQFVVLEYKTKEKDAETLCFVGKGITFDSGGLSLKPSGSMETMKEDMAGAAAVLGAMDVIGAVKPAVNVVAILPLSENLPSGKAIKPGDIVTMYNGKTVEILNTDAEGRLILADALSYGQKEYKPAAMVDLATLTGVCQYALGPVYSGLFSCNDKLVEKMYEASNISGDKVWRLPMNEDYKAAIKSTVADVKNVGNKRYMSGAITAAWFLHNFVGEIPWAHIDIAGTAFDVPDISYYPAGATGVGVRLLVELAMRW